MSLEKAIEENTAALLALTAVMSGAKVAPEKKQVAPPASSLAGATPEVKVAAPVTAIVLDYEKDIKPVCLQLAAKKGRDALLAVYTEVGVPAKDAKPEQYPAMLIALQAALKA